MARTNILGKSGTGKSWMLGKYLEEVVPRFPYGVHFDLENEEKGLTIPGRDGTDPVFASLYVDQQGREEWDIPATIARHGKLRVVPDGLTKQEMVDLAAEIAKTAMHLTDDPDASFHLSFDEAHNIAPNQNLDERISRAITGGRKRGLEWAAATQRAQNIHEDILTQANWGIYFRMTGDSDLYKVDASIDAFSAHEQLPKLADRECIIEDKASGDWYIYDTETIERAHPHLAEDDGTADDFLEAAGNLGEEHEVEPEQE